MKAFKKYVKRKFPDDHPIQVVQYETDDFIEDDSAILAKIQIWLHLAQLKG